MRLIYFLVFYITTISIIQAQVYTPDANSRCIPYEDEAWLEERQLIIQTTSNTTNELKLVRVNFHIVSKTDSSGHFTETGDNLGSNYNGYQLVYDVFDNMTGKLSWNQPMNLPLNNSTPAPSKNYKFVLDGIYFVHDNNYYSFPSINSQNLSLVGHKTDSVLNIFLTEGTARYGGYAMSINPNSNIKYTENRDFHHKYKTWNPNDSIVWLYDTYASQLNHELTHLLGLSHTVMYNSGDTCNSISNINTNCDDGCTDTPTAWDMRAVTGLHPACKWYHQWTPHCSSNMMDYAGGNSLTPCQLNIIHTNLDNGMKSYKACSAVLQDLTLCNIGYPEITYFGKNITIGTCGNAITIDKNQRKKICFSQEVSLQNIEILEGTEFEISYLESCP